MVWPSTGVVESLLRLVCVDWKVPNLSILCRRHCPEGDLQSKSAERGQNTLNVSIPYRVDRGPLHLLFDTTGVKAEGETPLHNAAKRSKRNAEIQLCFRALGFIAALEALLQGEHCIDCTIVADTDFCSAVEATFHVGATNEVQRHKTAPCKSVVGIVDG